MKYDFHSNFHFFLKHRDSCVSLHNNQERKKKWGERSQNYQHGSARVRMQASTHPYSHLHSYLPCLFCVLFNTVEFNMPVLIIC